MIWTAAALLVTLAFARVSTYPQSTESTYPIVGGITDTNVNIPEVRDALNFAVGKHNQESVYMSEVVKVIKATSQVVEGMLYRFELEMAILGCKPWTQKMCADNPDLKKPYTCYFEVWSRPWMGPPQLMKNDCNN